MFKSSRYHTIWYIIPVFACLVSYWGSLDGNFLFDDTATIINNKDVTDPKTTLKTIFQHDFWGANLTNSGSHKSYRPLTILLFHFEWNYFKISSYGMKAINLAMHCLNTCLVLKFLKCLTGSLKQSTIGSVFFAVHPIHTEPVCAIVGRAELIFCLCFLLCTIIFIKCINEDTENYTEWLRLGVIVLISSCGLFFKESAITILPFCVFLDIVCYAIDEKGLNIKDGLIRIMKVRNMILLIITGLLLIFRLSIQNFQSPQFTESDNPIAANDNLITKLLSQNFLYVLNIWILLCPQWLCYDWALGCVELMTSIFDGRFTSILLMYIYFYKILQHQTPILIIAIGLLIIPFLPACGIIKVGFVIAERVLYVPSIGICLLSTVGFTTIVRKFPKFKYFLNFLLFLFIMLFIFRTRQRAMEWRNEAQLFTSGLNVCPNNAKVHYNIARFATSHGDKKTAFKHYHKAILLYPKYEAALMNLGNLYKEMEDYTTSEYYFKKSLEVLEEFPAAWMNLGIVQALQQRYDEALESYQKALKYRKNYAKCYYNIGNLYLQLKHFSQALQSWQESVAINPKRAEAWINMLTLMDNRGLYEDVIRLSEKALSHVQNGTAILFIRANVFGKLKHYIEAEQIYQEVIKASPNNSLYYTNLGVLYHRWGKLDLAIENYQKAVQLNDKSKTAKDNLKKLLN